MKMLVRALVVALAVLLCSALVGAPASAQPADSGSQVTKSGKPSGEFSKLAVTVSQTTNLGSQTVRVSWTGGAPTIGRIQTGAVLPGNFLQVMQCWGDDPGPDRTQCQFGANGNGYVVDSRKAQVDRGGKNDLVDPREDLKAIPGDATNIPFWPVSSPTRPVGAVGGAANFNDTNLDLQITNEVPAVATRPDGSGEVDFEIQTLRESSGLGCGAPVTKPGGSVTGRQCWLVVVPRGTKEVNGQLPVTGLGSSALSPTNWDNRIEFRLDFIPQGNPCPIGAAEKLISGHELALDAVSSWQPALCAGGGNLYSYTQLTDDRVRQGLTGGGDPGLTVLSAPVPADTRVAERPVVYAPLAVSAVTVAFKIVRRPDPQVPEGDPARVGEGSPFTAMKLTPRLVAKLLTQSYRGVEPPQDPGAPLPAGAAQPTVPPANPIGLTNDPEFLALNPDYRDRLPVNLYADVLVQGGTSDLIGQLWDWVLADADARAFVAGTAADGTVVNSANKGLQPPITSYPRNDAFCRITSGFVNGSAKPPNNVVDLKFCTSDGHIYAVDMHDAGRATTRGDQLAGDYAATPNLQPDNSYSWPKRPRQAPDQQALIAIVDAATAQRYGLATASLRNAAGTFVAPDQAGLAAGLAAMKPGAVKDVLTPDPTSTDPRTYPLTSLSYAATVPAALPAASGKVWGTFLRYAAIAGQVPGQAVGQLPAGYLPLTDALRRQALAAAATIEAQAGKSAAPAADPTPVPAAGGGTAGGGTAGGSGGAPTDGAPTGGVPAGNPSGDTGATGSGTPGTSGAADAGADTAVTTPAGNTTTGAGTAAPVGTGTQQVAENRPTPALPAPAVGALLVALLIGGGLAAASAPVTHLLSTRLGTAEGGDETDRTTDRRAIAWLPARPALFARRR